MPKGVPRKPPPPPSAADLLRDEARALRSLLWLLSSRARAAGLRLVVRGGGRAVEFSADAATDLRVEPVASAVPPPGE